MRLRSRRLVSVAVAAPADAVAGAGGIAGIAIDHAAGDVVVVVGAIGPVAGHVAGEIFDVFGIADANRQANGSASPLRGEEHPEQLEKRGSAARRSRGRRRGRLGSLTRRRGQVLGCTQPRARSRLCGRR